MLSPQSRLCCARNGARSHQCIHHLRTDAGDPEGCMLLIQIQAIQLTFVGNIPEIRRGKDWRHTARSRHYG